jgi:hypothetical protein
MSKHFLVSVLIATFVVLSGTRCFAQESKTVALAKQLTELLDHSKLDSIAARVAGSTDQFVAALYFPGAQLLVIGAKYSAPPLLYERVLMRKYRDVYLDLNAATDPSTRVVIEDIEANGLRARRASKESFDFYTKGTGSRMAFDGEWKKQKVSEEQYFTTFTEADSAYTQMLESLIAEAKRSGS